MLIGAHWPLSLDVVNRPFSGVLNITMCAAGNHLRAQKDLRWEVCCRSGRKPLGCIFMIAEYGIKILVGRIVVGTAILTGQPMNLSIYMFFGERGIARVVRPGWKKNEWAERGSRAVWNIRSIQRNGRHECEFPEMLAERVIRLFTDKDNVILDPFVGSGTTTTIAKRLNRKYVGIDRLKKYAQLAEERTNAE